MVGPQNQQKLASENNSVLKRNKNQILGMLPMDNSLYYGTRSWTHLWVSGPETEHNGP